LHRLLTEKDQEAATINANAIPAIGAGILLEGVPEALAEIRRTSAGPCFSLDLLS
jgi:hypothetical protein